MQMLKNPLTAVCEVREHDPAILEMIMACKIRRNASWNSAIRFPDQQTKEALIYVFSQIGRDQAAETTTEQTTESEELGKKLEQQYNQTRNGGSQTLALNDPSIKFAVCPPFLDPASMIDYLQSFAVPETVLPIDRPAFTRCLYLRGYQS